MDLEQKVRYVGILVSIVGALVVSPSVTARAVGEFGAWVAALPMRLVRYLGLAAPLDIKLHVDSAVHAHAVGGGFAHSPVAFTAGATRDEKLEHLRERLSELDAAMSRAEAEAHNRAQQQDRALAAVRGEVHAAVAGLADRLTAAERAATTAASRALPVVGVGIVLSSASPELGSRPVLAVLLIVGASLYAAWAAWASVAAQRAASELATR